MDVDNVEELVVLAGGSGRASSSCQEYGVLLVVLCERLFLINGHY